MTRSELLWVLSDYQQAGIEPPEGVRDQPGRCEGELMSEDELAAFLTDSVATLRILHDRGSQRYGAVLAVFRTDLRALVELGRLSGDEYNDLTSDANLRF